MKTWLLSLMLACSAAHAEFNYKFTSIFDGPVTDRSVTLNITTDRPVNVYSAMVDTTGNLVWRFADGSWTAAQFNSNFPVVATVQGTQSIKLVQHQYVQGVSHDWDLYVAVGTNESDWIITNLGKINKLLPNQAATPAHTPTVAPVTNTYVAPPPVVTYGTPNVTTPPPVAAPVQCNMQDLRSANHWTPSQDVQSAPDSWVPAVPVRGSSAFQCQIRQALYYIYQKSPNKWYPYVAQRLTLIYEAATSGVYPWNGQFGLGDTAYTYSSARYIASAIIHDARHVEQYRSYLAAHPGQSVPLDAYSGATGEADAMALQIQAMYDIGVPQAYIDAVKATLPTFSDLNGNGVRDPGDMTLQTW